MEGLHCFFDAIFFRHFLGDGLGGTLGLGCEEEMECVREGAGSEVFG